LARARLRPVIQALCQHTRHYRRQLRHAGGRYAHRNRALGEQDGTALRALSPPAALPPRPMSRTAELARSTRRPPASSSAQSPTGPHLWRGRWRRSPPADAARRAWLTRHYGAVDKPAGLGRAPAAGPGEDRCPEAWSIAALRQESAACWQAAHRPENGAPDARSVAHDADRSACRDCQGTQARQQPAECPDVALL
jgi:hypothetical protein